MYFAEEMRSKGSFCIPTVDHPELCIVDEFVDDGYSGSNFERPAFQNLFRELEQGTINCVLVKDLSRFGRNYIEVGRYLERIFPVMRVRLIADKRCTGTNFDRPEFERLLKALQERKIDCIVVKDFSRLGRNFVETGQYLEQMFPLFGVRFIAINDNYDSLNSQSRDGIAKMVL